MTLKMTEPHTQPPEPTLCNETAPVHITNQNVLFELYNRDTYLNVRADTNVIVNNYIDMGPQEYHDERESHHNPTNTFTGSHHNPTNTFTQLEQQERVTSLTQPKTILKLPERQYTCLIQSDGIKSVNEGYYSELTIPKQILTSANEPSLTEHDSSLSQLMKVCEVQNTNVTKVKQIYGFEKERAALSTVEEVPTSDQTDIDASLATRKKQDPSVKRKRRGNKMRLSRDISVRNSTCTVGDSSTDEDDIIEKQDNPRKDRNRRRSISETVYRSPVETAVGTKRTRRKSQSDTLILQDEANWNRIRQSSRRSQLITDNCGNSRKEIAERKCVNKQIKKFVSEWQCEEEAFRSQRKKLICIIPAVIVVLIVTLVLLFIVGRIVVTGCDNKHTGQPLEDHVTSNNIDKHIISNLPQQEEVCVSCSSVEIIFADEGLYSVVQKIKDRKCCFADTSQILRRILQVSKMDLVMYLMWLLKGVRTI